MITDHHETPREATEGDPMTLSTAAARLATTATRIQPGDILSREIAQRAASAVLLPEQMTEENLRDAETALTWSMRVYAAANSRLPGPVFA